MKKIILLALFIGSFFFCENVFAADFTLDYDNSSTAKYRYYSNTIYTGWARTTFSTSFNGLSGNFIPFPVPTAWEYSYSYGVGFNIPDYDYPEFQKEKLTFKFYIDSSVDISTLELRSILTTDYNLYGKNYEFNKDIGMVDNQLLYYDDYAFITYFPVCNDNDPRVHECTVEVSANLTLLNEKYDNSSFYLMVLFGRNYETLYYGNIVFSTSVSYTSYFDSATTLGQNSDIEWTNEEQVNKSFWDILSQLPIFLRNIFNTILNLPLRIAEAIGGFFEWLAEKIGEFFSPLAENIANAIHNLFIPSEDFFERNFRVLYMLFEEKMGFLWYPVTLIENFIEYVKAIPNSTDAIFNIPKIEFMGYVLVPAMTYNLMDIITSNSAFSNIYNIYRIFVSGLIVLWLVELAIKKEKEFMGGR